jgi:hypothetical protein
VATQLCSAAAACSSWPARASASIQSGLGDPAGGEQQVPLGVHAPDARAGLTQPVAERDARVAVGQAVLLVARRGAEPRREHVRPAGEGVAADLLGDLDRPVRGGETAAQVAGPARQLGAGHQQVGHAGRTGPRSGEPQGQQLVGEVDRRGPGEHLGRGTCEVVEHGDEPAPHR